MTRLMFLKQGEEAKNAEVARLAGNGDDIGKVEKDENDAEEEDVLEEDQFGRRWLHHRRDCDLESNLRERESREEASIGVIQTNKS